MRLVPAATSTARSLMVTVGKARLRSGEEAALREGAAALGKVAVDLGAEGLHQRAHGTDGGVAQGAQRVAADVAGDRQQELRVARPALAMLDALQEQLHPVGPLAAGGALAARLVVEELGE